MNHFRTLAIAASLATTLSYATVTFSKPPPPPPPPPYNPQIAYTVISQGGRTTTINVSNADGTDVVSLYSTRNLTGGLKFAPSGNQIVFVEQNDIKVLTYAVSPSQGVTTTSVNTLTSEPYTPLFVDVSPDGMKLLFVEHTANPNQWAVWVMSMSGGSRTPINLAPDTYYDAVWAHSNSRIAVIQGAPVQAGFGQQTIQVIDLDVTNNYAPSIPKTVFISTMSQLYQIQRIESAHTSDTLVFSATSGSNLSVYEVDMGGAFDITNIVAGSNASFNVDDSMILFVGPTANNLYTYNVNAHTQTQITSSVPLTRPDFLP